MIDNLIFVIIKNNIKIIVSLYTNDFEIRRNAKLLIKYSNQKIWTYLTQVRVHLAVIFMFFKIFQDIENLNPFQIYSKLPLLFFETIVENSKVHQ